MDRRAHACRLPRHGVLQLRDVAHPQDPLRHRVRPHRRHPDRQARDGVPLCAADRAVGRGAAHPAVHPRVCQRGVSVGGGVGDEGDLHDRDGHGVAQGRALHPRQLQRLGPHQHHHVFRHFYPSAHPGCGGEEADLGQDLQERVSRARLHDVAHHGAARAVRVLRPARVRQDGQVPAAHPGHRPGAQRHLPDHCGQGHLLLHRLCPPRHARLLPRLPHRLWAHPLPLSHHRACVAHHHVPHVWHAGHPTRGVAVRTLRAGRGHGLPSRCLAPLRQPHRHEHHRGRCRQGVRPGVGRPLQVGMGQDAPQARGPGAMAQAAPCLRRSPQLHPRPLREPRVVGDPLVQGRAASCTRSSHSSPDSRGVEEAAGGRGGDGASGHRCIAPGARQRQSRHGQRHGSTRRQDGEAHQVDDVAQSAARRRPSHGGGARARAEEVGASVNRSGIAQWDSLAITHKNGCSQPFVVLAESGE
mmetsp:Transcript_40281/g.87172  ORF Transcript_40281/g.87172 Transcript_40281/m.87172 type:complete len:470 (-) Transcript_40281:152-1561(-)